MAQVRIESGELMSLSSEMHNWLTQMEQIQNQMVQRVCGLESSWNDAQYQMFLEQLKMISKNLKSGTDALETMRRALQTMAQGMDQQAQIYRRTMGGVNVQNLGSGW